MDNKANGYFFSLSDGNKLYSYFRVRSDNPIRQRMEKNKPNQQSSQIKMELNAHLTSA